MFPNLQNRPELFAAYTTLLGGVVSKVKDGVHAVDRLLPAPSSVSTAFTSS
jgi:hypothetical protein